MIIIQCTEKEKKGLERTLRCTNINCYGSTCDNCFGQVRDGKLHNVKFVLGTENVDALSHQLKDYCAKVKCSDCMFMQDGKCQFDYHCPADFEEESKDDELSV